MYTTQRPVIGVGDEAGEVVGRVEVLVDDGVPFGAPFGDDGVDGEDDLLVAFGPSEVGERPWEAGHDRTATGGMERSVGVVASDDDLPGVGVNVPRVLFLTPP